MNRETAQDPGADTALFRPMELVSLALLAALIFIVLPSLLDVFRLNLVGKYMTYAFVALGLCWGFGGILSLGQGMFFGVGGYCMAMFLKLRHRASPTQRSTSRPTPRWSKSISPIEESPPC